MKRRLSNVDEPTPKRKKVVSPPYRSILESVGNAPSAEAVQDTFLNSMFRVANLESGKLPLISDTAQVPKKSSNSREPRYRSIISPAAAEPRDYDVDVRQRMSKILQTPITDSQRIPRAKPKYRSILPEPPHGITQVAPHFDACIEKLKAPLRRKVPQVAPHFDTCIEKLKAPLPRKVPPPVLVSSTPAPVVPISPVPQRLSLDTTTLKESATGNESFPRWMRFGGFVYDTQPTDLEFPWSGEQCEKKQPGVPGEICAKEKSKPCKYAKKKQNAQPSRKQIRESAVLALWEEYGYDGDLKVKNRSKMRGCVFVRENALMMLREKKGIMLDELELVSHVLMQPHASVVVCPFFDHGPLQHKYFMFRRERLPHKNIGLVELRAFILKQLYPEHVKEYLGPGLSSKYVIKKKAGRRKGGKRRGTKKVTIDYGI